VPTENQEPKGSSPTLLYGLSVAPAQFLFVLTGVYFVKFGTDVLLVAPSSLALLYGLSRLWDAISDPMAGFLSDRTRAAFGRRRTWILGSTVPMALTALMVWHPPEALTGTPLLIWLGLALFAFSTAYTAFEVPHNALGAELSDRSDVRARLFGMRAWMMVAGTYAALTLGIGAIRTAQSPRESATWLIAGIGFLYVLSVVLTIGRLKERPEFAGLGGRSPIRAYRDLLANQHARTILTVIFCEYVGTGGATVLIAYLYQYVLHAENLTEVAFVVMGIAQVLSVPLWVRLARRMEKARIWQGAMALAAVGCLLQFGVGVFGGSALLFVGVSFLYAFGASATHVLGSAILADVIDSDELKTGERKEGVYFASWHFTRKAMQGSMIVVAGLALEASGFVPNAVQSRTTSLTILGLATLAPTIGYALGALLLLRYRLKGERLAELREALDQRRARDRAESGAGLEPGTGP
jgi:Na+/melibiose symporter-like transporter